MLPRECAPDQLRAQELTVPPDEDCLVLKLLTLCTCFSFFYAPSHLRSIRCHTQSFSLSIHSRIYGVQFSSSTPSASQRARKAITSRSTSLTSFSSRTMSQWFAWSPNIRPNYTTPSLPIRPLRTPPLNHP